MTAILPPLRPDLRVERGPVDWDGSVTATIFDPLRSRFFRIGWRERVMLAHWHLGKPDSVAEAAAREIGGPVGAAEVEDLAAFLLRNELAVGAELRIPAGQGTWKKALHSYLFFKIPMVSPDRFVAALQPRLDAILASRFFPFAALAVTVWAIVSTFSRWDVFLATLPPIANAGGLAVYGAMIVLSAIIHELGHAYAARRAGCRVGVMGIAFMVMVPTLYTDMTDAWALPDRRRRLSIGLAGVAAEGALAVMALAVWPFLPEGPVQSAAVALATTALVTSLAINLNPLMRFDGYYVLSDLAEIPNLQDRAFALWNWRLRRALFGIQAPPPEMAPPFAATLMNVWAWVVIPWRAMVYLGIALLVYHVTFKLAGIALFAVEIGWFLVRPCWSEMRIWWSLRAAMRPRRLVLTGAVAFGGLMVLVVPWSGSLSLGAVIEAQRHVRLYAPVPARLADISIRQGAKVAEGDVLLTFEAPDLDRRLEENRVKLELARWQVDHLLTQGSDMDRLKVERQALDGLEAERAGLLDLSRRLQLRAPFAGSVTDLHPAVVPGRWIGAIEPLAALADSSACRVLAYVEEGDLNRLAAGAGARFYPDDPASPPVVAKLAAIEASAAARLDDAYFHAEQGGPIAIRHDGSRPVPASAIFRLRLDAEGGCRTRQRGVIVILGKNESIAVGIWRWGAGALLAESGL